MLEKIFGLKSFLPLAGLFFLGVIFISVFPPKTPDQGQLNQVVNRPNLNTSCDAQQTIEATEAATYQVITPSGHASGFGIDESGLIATNSHVVEGQRNIRVRINGTPIDATIWNIEEADDLAVLKVGTKINTVEWFSSDRLATAETLYAIGWSGMVGGEPAITQGILSRKFSVSNNVPILQTDAPINPGNSGGPLINSCGVVGVNTAKLVWVEEQVPAEGIGYALASERAEPVLSSLANRPSEKTLLDNIFRNFNIR